MIRIAAFDNRHATGVIDVILPIQQAEFGIPVTLEGQPDLLDIPGYYQKGRGNFWVALDGDAVVGTISLLDIGHGQGALRKMFVRAEYRGAQQGVAARLLETLVSWCRHHQVAEVYLGTTANFLAAHRFYEKHGFLQIDASALPAAFPIMKVDTRFYMLTV